MGFLNWLFGKKTPATPASKAPRRQPGIATASLQVGARVLACWADSFFYPGRIRQMQGDTCEIAYDDGDAAWVHGANVRALDIGQGSAVYCRFHAGPMYLPATVREQKGEKIQVQYESGEREWTTVSMVRVQRPLADVPGPPAQPAPAAVPPPAAGPGPMMAGMMNPQGMPPSGPFIPDVGDPVADSNWRVGDRVLGRWFDFYWYPATILAIGAKGVHILFDDSDQRVVTEIGLQPLDIDEGEELFIRPKNQPQRIYTPARVLRVQGEVIDVELEDGTQETNQKVSRARFWRCPVGFQSLPFEEADRVWAQDIDGCTYPAEVLSIDHDKIMVHFLDGPERMLTPELVKPFALRAGTAVDCRWKGGAAYFPGKVTQIEGDRVHLAYDDGDQEWTTVRLIRLPVQQGK